MKAKAGKSDIVDDYRAARARLRLGRYERYLVERLAVRVERLLEKRHEAERAGDADEPGRRASSLGSLPRAGVHANKPPTRGECVLATYRSSSGESPSESGIASTR